MPDPTNHSSDRMRLAPRFSLAGLFVLTAVIAVHLAIGRWSLGLVVFVAPFSLSVLTIEILRRLFGMPLLRAMVVGVLLGACFYSFTIGGSEAWEYWFQPDYVRWDGRLIQHHPQFRVLFRVFVRALRFPLMWYVVAGMCVMLAYTMVLMYRDRRVQQSIRKHLLASEETQDDDPAEKEPSTQSTRSTVPFQFEQTENGPAKDDDCQSDASP